MYDTMVTAHTTRAPASGHHTLAPGIDQLSARKSQSELLWQYIDQWEDRNMIMTHQWSDQWNIKFGSRFQFTQWEPDIVSYQPIRFWWFQNVNRQTEDMSRPQSQHSLGFVTILVTIYINKLTIFKLLIFFHIPFYNFRIPRIYFKEYSI